MKQKLLSLLGAGAIFVGMCTAANADFFNDGYFYVGGTGSFAFQENHDFLSDANIASTRDYDTGYGFGASIGYQYCQWRFEVEGLYRHNDLDKQTNPLGTFNANGEVTNWALMFNAFYDIPVYCDFGIYVGAGLGVAFNDIEMTSINGVAQTPSSNSDELFAWQLMGGVSYDITECVAMTAGYRLFATDKISNARGFKTRDIPLTHSIDLGLRIKL